MADDTASALFSADDLSDLLGQSVEDGRARIVEAVVWGWLRPVLAMKTRPNEAPEEIFSWALELGAIAHENPAGKTSSQLGDATDSYSVERRTEILEEVATSEYGVRPSAAGGNGLLAAPKGRFPAAEPYPDPARTSRRLIGW